jgi:hypothetical protein
MPFSVGGGLIALYLAGLDFSVSAAIGFISLFGVAVMDGILNITYFRELRASGMEIPQAVWATRAPPRTEAPALHDRQWDPLNLLNKTGCYAAIDLCEARAR